MSRSLLGVSWDGVGLKVCRKKDIRWYDDIIKSGNSKRVTVTCALIFWSGKYTRSIKIESASPPVQRLWQTSGHRPKGAAEVLEMVLATIKLFPVGTPGLVYCITRHVELWYCVEFASWTASWGIVECVFLWWIYVIVTSMDWLYMVTIRICSLIPY